MKRRAKKQTIIERLRLQNNDYTIFEPFIFKHPIPSSIIIPVYNNREIFEKTLKNLSNHPEINKFKDLFEIIVINDGSEEDIKEVFYRINIPCKKKYCYFSKNKGRSAARNKGICYSEKELLFFFDADILLPLNYFREVWAIHNSVPNAVVVGLAEKISLQDSRIERILEDYSVSPKIEKDFRYKKNLKKEYKIIETTNWFKNFGYYKKISHFTLPYMVVTHNISVRKRYVLSVKGFDERFRTWGFEDTFFGAKLIAKGCYVIPLKNTGVFKIIHKRKGKISYRNRGLYEKLINEESI